MADRFDRISTDLRDGYAVLDLGAVDIWDGADLSLLRESLSMLVTGERRGRIGVDLGHVKYIPSGFFGMMYDWLERGIDVRLYDPQPNVAGMMWFRQFAEPCGRGVYELVREGRIELPPEGQPGYREPEEEDAEALLADVALVG